MFTARDSTISGKIKPLKRMMLRNRSQGELIMDMPKKPFDVKNDVGNDRDSVDNMSLRLLRLLGAQNPHASARDSVFKGSSAVDFSDEVKVYERADFLHSGQVRS